MAGIAGITGTGAAAPPSVGSQSREVALAAAINASTPTPTFVSSSGVHGGASSGSAAQATSNNATKANAANSTTDAMGIGKANPNIIGSPGGGTLAGETQAAEGYYSNFDTLNKANAQSDLGVGTATRLQQLTQASQAAGVDPNTVISSFALLSAGQQLNPIQESVLAKVAPYTNGLITTSTTSTTTGEIPLTLQGIPVTLQGLTGSEAQYVPAQNIGIQHSIGSVAREQTLAQQLTLTQASEAAGVDPNTVISSFALLSAGQQLNPIQESVLAKVAPYTNGLITTSTNSTTTGEIPVTLQGLTGSEAQYVPATGKPAEIKAGIENINEAANVGQDIYNLKTLGYEVAPYLNKAINLIGKELPSDVLNQLVNNLPVLYQINAQTLQQLYTKISSIDVNKIGNEVAREPYTSDAPIVLLYMLGYKTPQTKAVAQKYLANPDAASENLNYAQQELINIGNPEAVHNFYFNLLPNEIASIIANGIQAINERGAIQEPYAASGTYTINNNQQIGTPIGNEIASLPGNLGAYGQIQEPSLAALLAKSQASDIKAASGDYTVNGPNKADYLNNSGVGSIFNAVRTDITPQNSGLTEQQALYLNTQNIPNYEIPFIKALSESQTEPAVAAAENLGAGLYNNIGIPLINSPVADPFKLGLEELKYGSALAGGPFISSQVNPPQLPYNQNSARITNQLNTIGNIIYNTGESVPVPLLNDLIAITLSQPFYSAGYLGSPNQTEIGTISNAGILALYAFGEEILEGTASVIANGAKAGIISRAAASGLFSTAFSNLFNLAENGELSSIQSDAEAFALGATLVPALSGLAKIGGEIKADIAPDLTTADRTELIEIAQGKKPGKVTSIVAGPNEFNVKNLDTIKFAALQSDADYLEKYARVKEGDYQELLKQAQLFPKRIIARGNDYILFDGTDGHIFGISKDSTDPVAAYKNLRNAQIDSTFKNPEEAALMKDDLDNGGLNMYEELESIPSTRPSIQEIKIKLSSGAEVTYTEKAVNQFSTARAFLEQGQAPEPPIAPLKTGNVDYTLRAKLPGGRIRQGLGIGPRNILLKTGSFNTVPTARLLTPSGEIETPTGLAVNYGIEPTENPSATEGILSLYQQYRDGKILQNGISKFNFRISKIEDIGNNNYRLTGYTGDRIQSPLEILMLNDAKDFAAVQANPLLKNYFLNQKAIGALNTNDAALAYGRYLDNIQKPVELSNVASDFRSLGKRARTVTRDLQTPYYLKAQEAAQIGNPLNTLQNPYYQTATEAAELTNPLKGIQAPYYQTATEAAKINPLSDLQNIYYQSAQLLKNRNAIADRIKFNPAYQNLYTIGQAEEGSQGLIPNPEPAVTEQSPLLKAITDAEARARFEEYSKLKPQPNVYETGEKPYYTQTEKDVRHLGDINRPIGFAGANRIIGTEEELLPEEYYSGFEQGPLQQIPYFIRALSNYVAPQEEEVIPESLLESTPLTNEDYNLGIGKGINKIKEENAKIPESFQTALPPTLNADGTISLTSPAEQASVINPSILNKVTIPYNPVPTSVFQLPELTSSYDEITQPELLTGTKTNISNIQKALTKQNQVQKQNQNQTQNQINNQLQNQIQNQVQNQLQNQIQNQVQNQLQNQNQVQNQVQNQLQAQIQTQLQSQLQNQLQQQLQQQLQLQVQIPPELPPELPLPLFLREPIKRKKIGTIQKSRERSIGIYHPGIEEAVFGPSFNTGLPDTSLIGLGYRPSVVTPTDAARLRSLGIEVPEENIEKQLVYA